MSTANNSAAPAVSSREQWLASLRVGDKIVWPRSDGRPRSVHTIQRETPKHWVIHEDWIVCKARGISRNYSTGILFQPYAADTDAAIKRREAAFDRQSERSELIRRIAQFSTKRLREIVGAQQ